MDAGRCGRGLAVILATLLYFSSSPLAAQGLSGEFDRGDCNTDGIVDMSDAIFNLSCLVLGSECSGCDNVCDVNDDAVVQTPA